MTQRNLLLDPIWQARDLGLQLPESEDAVSVAMPRWRDVVGYEEKRPEVVDRLQGGYPRCVINRGVMALAERLAAGSPCLPFPSPTVARACVAFIEAQSGAEARVVQWEGEFGVATTEAGAEDLKAFWRYPGQIVSSRRARAALSGICLAHRDGGEIRGRLRRQLAALYDCDPGDVFLHPSGMAALYDALRILLVRRPQAPTVQLGFPYADSLKLQERFGAGATLLYDLHRSKADLEELSARGPIAGCFTEVPGNPLLSVADLREITPVLRRHGIPLVADDAVAGPLNVDLGAHSDLVATSLTKFLAGTGDTMGGVLICNPSSPYYPELKAIAASLHEELLWVEDAAVLEAQISSFPERMRLHNANGLEIARRLRAHPAIEQVWYPKWSCKEAYEALRRPGGGFGAVVSFLPKDGAAASPAIYDRLSVSKGPSFGTSFTLACPFTLLGHYSELAWAESRGVSRNLIRISVGLEDVEELWGRIALALP